MIEGIVYVVFIIWINKCFHSKSPLSNSITWRDDGLPRWLSCKESACNTGDTGLIRGLGWSPGGGHSNPLQHSCQENPMDRGAQQASVHRVAKSWTRLKWLSVSTSNDWHPWILLLACLASTPVPSLWLLLCSLALTQFPKPSALSRFPPTTSFSPVPPFVWNTVHPIPLATGLPQWCLSRGRKLSFKTQCQFSVLSLLYPLLFS